MADTQLQIRQAQARDEPNVRACAEAAYAQYVGPIGKKPAPMIADFAALIASGHIHVAVHNEEIAGFIVFHANGDHMFLENIAVHPDAAGQGIGKRLMAFCEAEAARLGATSIKLYTNEKMTENLSIYPHLGYHETERKEEDGFKRVFFEKFL